MATRCGINSAPAMMVQPHRQHFVSSAVYHGYVPLGLGNETARDEPEPGAMDVDVDAHQQQHHHQHHQQVQKTILDSRQCCLGQRKRSFGQDGLVGTTYVPNIKRLREEAVVTNIYSVVQETASGQKKNVDWPRCTMNRHYCV